MYEKELVIERDIFGRLLIRRRNRMEFGAFQTFLFFVAFLLAWLYGVVYVPLKILVSKPDRLSFWTYFFWLGGFGFMCFGFFNSGTLAAYPSISAFISDFVKMPGEDVLGFMLMAGIFIINILAIFSRIGKAFSGNNEI